MLGADLFRCLDIERKRYYLSKILYPIVKKGEDGEEYLETFLFGSSDEDLFEFYEVLLNPEKLKSYINKKGEQLRKGNLEMKNLYNSLNVEKIVMMESLDQEDSDAILNQM